MGAVIAYDEPVLDLIDELNETGHVSHREYRKTSVTFHHNAGRLSHQGLLRVWQVRPASAHFNLDGAGTCAQYVKVNEYAWAVGNTIGNQETISIEMGNATLGPDWTVADITWKKAARLAGWLFYKVIGERPTSSNLHYHSHWSATQCAGPYMDKLYKQVLAAAQEAYDMFKAGKAVAEPTPEPSKDTAQKSLTTIAAEVWAGKWGSGDDRVRRLSEAGYDADRVQALVNRGVGKNSPLNRPARKSIAEVAQEVIDGEWGNGGERRRRLFAAGYNATTVQNEVNRQLGVSSRKSVSQLAREVIAGEWGNGAERERRLSRAGYNYKVVQNEVNRLL